MTDPGGHQIDGFGCTLGKDNLIRTNGIDKARDFGAGIFKCLGRFVRQRMQAAMDIGVRGALEVGHGRDDAFRLLRTGRAIKIDQGLAMNCPRQDREFRPHFSDIKGGRIGWGLGVHEEIASNHVRARSENQSRTPSCSIASKTSVTKASTSKALAWASGMPRWRM